MQRIWQRVSRPGTCAMSMPVVKLEISWFDIDETHSQITLISWDSHSNDHSSKHVFVLEKQLRGSINGGTPKSSILVGFSRINHPFWGTPHFWKPLFVSIMFFPIFGGDSAWFLVVFGLRYSGRAGLVSAGLTARGLWRSCGVPWPAGMANGP